MTLVERDILWALNRQALVHAHRTKDHEKAKVLSQEREQLKKKGSASTAVSRSHHPQIKATVPCVAGCVTSDTSSTAAPLPKITKRQIEVVKQIACGKTLKEIAFNVGCSSKTIEYHWTLAREKIGLSSVALVTQWALKHNLVEFSI